MKHRRSVVGIAIVIALGALWWTIGHRTYPTPPAPAGPAVDTVRARRGTIAVTVPAVGRLGAAGGAQTELAFMNAGRIAAIDVHIGERVESGDILARLDRSGFALAADQARADALAAGAQARAAAVDRTSAEIAVDRSALARARALYQAGVTARKDVEAARAKLAADEATAQVNRASQSAASAGAQSADARAALAQRDLANATLRAPSAGVVTAIFRNVGASVDPSIAVIALAPTSKGSVLLQVAGTDAGRVRSGDLVQLHVVGTSERFDGRVVGVSGAVNTASQAAQISVAAAVPSALAGSAIDATIVVAHDRGVLVPREAIVADPASGKTLVFMERRQSGARRFAQRSIGVIFQNATTAEVTGLRSGTPIAAKGAFELLAPSGGG